MPRRSEHHSAASFRASRWWRRLDAEQRHVFDVVTRVYAFGVGEHVLETLIDWSAAPDDPLYRQVFPQRGMLTPRDFAAVEAALARGDDGAQIEALAREIRARQAPHPGDQLANAPAGEAGRPALQHKYRESVLYFPAGGQTCFSTCTYCFRWAQFVPAGVPRFAGRDVGVLVEHLDRHPHVTDVIVTGGDPLVLPTARWAELVDTLLPRAAARTLRLRVATKAPVHEPARLLAGDEGRGLLALLARADAGGLPVHLMLHAAHPRELLAPATRRALAALRPVTRALRLQAPLLAGVNDRASTWIELIDGAVDLGVVPYYMFVARDTGPSRHFAVPLLAALAIARDALASVSGLGRTLRGPVLSTRQGKLVALAAESDGLGGTELVLRVLQHRDPARVGSLQRVPVDARTTWVEGEPTATAAPAAFS